MLALHGACGGFAQGYKRKTPGEQFAAPIRYSRDWARCLASQLETSVRVTFRSQPLTLKALANGPRQCASC
jgi:hypothetical protein